MKKTMLTTPEVDPVGDEDRKQNIVIIISLIIAMVILVATCVGMGHGEIIL